MLTLTSFWLHLLHRNQGGWRLQVINIRWSIMRKMKFIFVDQLIFGTKIQVDTYELQIREKDYQGLLN